MKTTRTIILILYTLAISISYSCRKTTLSESKALVQITAIQIIKDIIESRNKEDFPIDSLFIICKDIITVVDISNKNTIDMECIKFKNTFPKVTMVEKKPDYELNLPIIHDLRGHYFIEFETFRIGKKQIISKVRFGPKGVTFVYEYQTTKSSGLIENKSLIEVIQN